MATTAIDFYRAATRESDRYGEDPWVFLRELLQNARDAGARRVTISSRDEGGLEEVTVADDGRGMTREHAQRFLFTLYASSKVGSEHMAGVFGVGFWSILAFEPDVIVLRSRTSGEGAGWQVTFDRGLEDIRVRPVSMAVGTSVKLSRARRGVTLGVRVWDAVRKDARHLRCRDHPEELVNVVVDGRRATEPMHPGTPGLAFRGPGMRGVVSLGEEPGVTLLAHGLRVRQAAIAEDLLFGPGHGGGAKKTIAHGGLWPQIVVDSDRLAVLMARGDVAQDRELERVVSRVEKETGRLYASELNRLAPRSLVLRVVERVAAWWSWKRCLVFGGVLGVAAVVFLMLYFSGRSVVGDNLDSGAAPALQQQAQRPYEDLSSTYLGPALDTVSGRQEAPDLRYSPEEATPALAAFKVVGLDEIGRPVSISGGLRPAPRLDQRAGPTLDIEVVIASKDSTLRIPLPTGHLVDPTSVLVDGRPEELWYTAADEPVIRSLDPGSERLVYRTFSASMRSDQPTGPWPSLPWELDGRIAALRLLAPVERIGKATELVKDLLETRLDRSTYELLRRGRARKDPLIASAFQVGGGDCDIVNAVLAAVLDSAGVPARLAVGWIGCNGAPLPGYHAWVEADLGGGRWVAADASSTNPGSGAFEGRSSGPSSSQTRGGDEAPMRRRVPTPTFWISGVVLSVVLGLGATLVLVWKRRFHRTLNAGEEGDPGPIVESILRDRDAWRGLPVARYRALVPEVGGSRRSLSQLERAAAAGRLFAARRPGGMVDRVKKAGGLVVDGGSRAGKAVISALCVADLDRWCRMSSSATEQGALARHVTEMFRGCGLHVEILEVNGLESPAESLHLPGEARIRILVDREGTEWRKAGTMLRTRPDESIFRAADMILWTLPLTDDAAMHVLGSVAREAVYELVGEPQ